MEDAQGADAVERTKKRTYILVDCDNVGLEQLKNMMANYISFGQCMFDYAIPGQEPLIITYLCATLDFLIEQGIMTWFGNHNDGEQQINFLFHVIARCDKFLILMHRAGNDYENFSAVQNKVAANLKLNLYERATKSFARDLVKTKDWVARDEACDVVATIAKLSDKRAKSGPPTPARGEWGGVNARTPTPAPRGPPAAKTVGWGYA